MTGALIGAGGGLVLGVILLIWVLRERSKRHEAEAARDNAKRHAKDLGASVDRLRVEVDVLRRDKNNCRAQIDLLRKTINGLHEKLASCRDPEAVAKLLNDELGEQL